MEIIESVDDLATFVPLKSFEGRTFRRDLLAYYTALNLYGASGSEAYLPKVKDVATFEEQTDEAGVLKFYVGVVRNSRAALIPTDKETIKRLCLIQDNERNGAPF
ncbi:hypothetical protein IJ103_00140 [Candidatus Saccharibacteria bacterium]|nr:hypothetical protein [Candidatus Saccharibacteria bacterium]